MALARPRMMKEERRPVFFGPAGEALYGCFHLPVGARQDLGIVLCYPWGQEYLRAHRAFVQLATRLAGRGYPVLRFDYLGCGDSSGDPEAGDVERWVADIASAARELRTQPGVRRIGLVGMRLGASLAALATAADADALVLWDPIPDGGSYIEEVRAMQQQMLRFSHVDPKLGLPEGGEREEVLGFPLTARQRTGIEGIDLLGLRKAPARRVLLLETDARPENVRLREHLASLAAEVEHLGMAERKLWLAEPMQGIVPFKLIEQVATWFESVDA
jgi:uncharacterized protein